MNQQHLTYQEMTNYGCFYTPDKFVDNLIEKIKLQVPHSKSYTFVDTSCGYGSFLRKLQDYKTIGCDIDIKAIEIAKEINPTSIFYNINTLSNFYKSMINLEKNEKVVIIGNPPYNDITSKVKNNIKVDKPCDIDKDLKTRDLGISFLLSYNKLQADYVAVLHPLSYMIKEANFKLLKPFYSNYTLIDHSIINSQDFYSTSKSTGFPIIIALYKKDCKGLTYEEICNMEFKTIDNKKFNLKFDSIKNYVRKYPSKNTIYQDDDILFFTMRDINALKRSRTFLSEYRDNAIIVDKDKFEYYCYIDIFKDYICHIPYYFGNSDVFIDNKKFEKLKDIFVSKCLERHPYLKKHCKNFVKNNNYDEIDKYFINLLGENYVY